MGKTITIVVVLIAIAAGVYFLVLDDDDETNDPDRMPEPAVLMEDAADNLEAADTFQMELRQSGTPTEITQVLDNIVYFDRAQAVFQGPDRLSGLVNILFGDIPAEVNLIIIGSDQYMKNSLLTAGQWQSYRLAEGFNGGDIKSRANGIGTALVSIEQIEMIGQEELDGIEVYHVRGMVDAERVQSITVGLIDTDEAEVPIEVFVRVRDSYPARIVITEPAPPAEDVDDESADDNDEDSSEPQATIWTVDFSLYNNDRLEVSEPQEVVEAEELLGAGGDDASEEDTNTTEDSESNGNEG